ncbi:store-operated calcium entry regulator STIMATE-like protein [Lates japonicus]|uniref:Store-operated calcium entry regulator STIMATE-like protein n=1 Tax=Lates japonicus TaxID=270547 RepID=A0AAD3NJJ0_LATJO|nr:store-operated calcium entry regulator STIMATE-like protein [Lates japonicus]
MRVFIPLSPFPTLLVICQAAINQAFILGIKVTFRSRFHALMLWKAGVEEDDGQRGIDLDEVLAGVVVKAYGHNAVVVAGDIMPVLLTVETDTDEASEGEEEPGDVGPVPQVHYSGGPLRPSWVVV